MSAAWRRARGAMGRRPNHRPVDRGRDNFAATSTEPSSRASWELHRPGQPEGSEVGGLFAEVDGLGRVSSCGVGAAGLEGEPRGPRDGGGAHPRWRQATAREGTLEPSMPFDRPAGGPPVPAQIPGQLLGGLAVAPCDRPVQRGAQVVELRGEAGEPPHLAFGRSGPASRPSTARPAWRGRRRGGPARPRRRHGPRVVAARIRPGSAGAGIDRIRRRRRRDLSTSRPTSAPTSPGVAARRNRPPRPPPGCNRQRTRRAARRRFAHRRRAGHNSSPSRPAASDGEEAPSAAPPVRSRKRSSSRSAS